MHNIIHNSITWYIRMINGERKAFSTGLVEMEMVVVEMKMMMMVVVEMEMENDLTNQSAMISVKRRPSL